MLGQLQLVDDVGTQQAEGVRERGEVEAGDQLLGDGCATDDVTPLDDQRAQARLGEVRAVDQPVVAAADDDRVVRALGMASASGCLSGRVEQRWSGDDGGNGVIAVVDRDLEVDPRARLRQIRRTRAMAMWRCSIGEYMKLVV